MVGFDDDLNLTFDRKLNGIADDVDQDLAQAPNALDQ